MYCLGKVRNVGTGGRTLGMVGSGRSGAAAGLRESSAAGGWRMARDWDSVMTG